MINLWVTKRGRKTLWVSRALSRVFDPLWWLPLTLVLAVWSGVEPVSRWSVLVLVFVWDAMLPVMFLFWWMRRGKVLSGWDIKDRSERIPLFVFVILAHLGGVVGSVVVGEWVLAEYLLVFWLLAVIYGLTTLRWKISIHTGVMSNLVTFLVLAYGREWVLGYVVVLLLIWARVIGKYHRLSQAVVGAMVPIVVLALWWLVR